MTQSRAQLASSNMPIWFCLRTQPKHEHIAAAALRHRLEIRCFAPRVRFPKATRRGKVWFVEAMFPGYLFAQFVFPLFHRRGGCLRAQPGGAPIRAVQAPPPLPPTASARADTHATTRR